MRIRGGQDMSTAPNSLLVEGNVLLTRSLYNGNSNHPPQISQYGFPFPFRPNHGDGFSVPILPNLNSYPEMTGNIGMIEPMCIPQTPITLDKNRRIQDREPHEVIDLFNECVTNTAIGVSEMRKAPPTPIALDKNKRLQDRLPREAIDLVNEIQTGRNEMGVWQPVAKDPVGLFFTKPVTPQMVSFRPQELDMNLVRPTEGVSVQQSEIGEHGERETQDIDLNKTPQHKPRRKKHRPKVIREGKSARTPKPVTPKPVTPKPGRNKETPSGKRKYVRKNKVMSPSDNPSGPALETVDRDSGSGTKSVRRCLNFDSQEPQARDVNPGPSSMFAHDTVTQVRDVCISGTVTSSTTKSAMPCVQSQEALEKNSPSRFPFDLNTSMNNISSGYIRIPESMPPPYQPCRRELQINSMENGCIGVSTNCPTPQTRRENIRVNLKEFARKIEHWKFAGNSLGSQEAGQKSHLDSNNSLDVLLGGTKRNHGLVDDARMSALKNFMHAFKRIDHVSGNHGHDQYFPEIVKKRRMEEQREFTSPGSSVVTCSPSSWNTSLAMPNNDQVFNSGDVQGTMPSTRSRLLVPRSCHLFTFAEAQRLVALEKLRASEHNISSDNRNANTSATVKPSIYISKDYIHPSTPEKVSARKDIQGNKIYIPQNRVEALPVNNIVEPRNTKCTKKEQVCLAKAMNSNTKKVHLQEHGAALYSYGSAVSENFKDKDSRLQVSFIQEGQKSRNSRELHRGVSVSGAVVTFVNSIDDLVRKLRHLNLNDAHEIVKETEEQKALVPYAGGGGTVVPYEGPFYPSRRRRPRPKVDLDQESHRVWKVLMGKESVDEGIDANKEKWWQEERRMFRGRVDSFIARMHLVQGDRRFSRWKGSVVDSVVGVFLTQNVSDHLSSSAFMALAARFPLKPKGNCSKLSAENVGAFTEPQNGCIIDLDDGIKWQESILSKKLSSHGPLFVTEEKEISRSNELLGINTVGGTIDNSEAKVSDLDENEREVSHESADNTATTSATMTGGTSIGDADDRRSMEDVVSSQGSVVSSQNSFGCQVQTLDQMNPNSILYFHAEDSMNGGMCNGLDSSTSFTELLQMAESTRFKELYSLGNGRVSPIEQCEATEKLACPEVDLRAPIPSQSGYADGNHPSVWRPNSHQHDIPSVLFTSSSSKSIATKSTNTIRENNSSHLPSTVSGMNITNTMRNTDQRCGPSEENCTRAMSQPFHDFLTSSYTRLIGNVSGVREESSSLFASTASGMNNINNVKMLSSRNSSNEAMGRRNLVGSSCAPSVSYNLQNFSNTGLMTLSGSNAERVGSNPHLPLTASGMIGRRYGSSSENSIDYIDQHVIHTLQEPPMIGTCETTCKHSVPPSTYTTAESCVDKCSFTQSSIQKERNEASSDECTLHICSNLPDEQTSKFQKKETRVESQVKSNEQAVRAQAQMQNGRIHQIFQKPANSLKANSEVVKTVESDLKDKVHSPKKVSATTMERVSKGSKENKVKAEAKTYDWDKLRKQACANSAKIERSSDNMDSIDWEAVRSADVKEISDTIRERGMNNMLAERIKEFLNRLVKDHGSIDLEWLRDVPSDITKDYLLSIRGLGLKSVECVRLLTLHHLAFPVDTNVGRICVRLGWVPLQPLPESLQLHLLEMYPVLETIQKYLWPRLCKLDQRTLYELHYQLITFGKVFCTKSKPNCNACPMRAECKHFASAYASSRLSLPGPEGKGLVSSTTPIASEPRHAPVFSPMPLPQLEGSTFSHEGIARNNCVPIIEEPTTPEPEEREILERDIEDAFYEDPDEIPHIELNLEQFSQNLQSYMQENKMELQDVDMSKALVAITPEAAFIPMPKLKNVSNLRTEHLVYELPDSHPLLEALDEREPDDPSPYLLAIWSPGETAQSTEPPKAYCDCQGSGKFCDKATCFACNSVREAQAQTVRGTLLIPCRTAMRGSFPLNGTYFQVNEMFADHDSSCEPINVPRTLLWNLPRRTVYFGTSIPTIFKGLTTEGIQHCFWRGFVCVRGFDRTTRAPRPLYARLHFPVSKVPRNKRKPVAAAREEE